MFDVIAFHGPDIIDMDANNLPQRRLYHQKYVFASIESSDNYPLCSANYDGYFNWTWTYKLDSEVRWGYFVIRDSNKDIVGPRKNMNWLNWSDMADVNNVTKKILRRKTKAVAWFVSNCITKSRREGYVMGLQKYLNQYGLQIDIYGACGGLECGRDKEEECNKMIETDYYFYLAFENAFSEDYVTEKVLIPLQHNAIPIVYGGADYTRFLPPDSYLDARELGVYKLGDQIYKLMQDPELYAHYFKWKNHYSYHRMSENVETDEYCQMCALLNNERKMTQISVYKQFQKWWDPPSATCY
ncbi:unnamed protein product [Arctia plantaginis]|uniref:Fucosyltransferase n=1 Tax=Arctia plantaginis TaxID=874455 RepID=A0A8S0YWL8_ARCPL|nr:unnamed protein product [Arctia plantaginis]